MNPTKDTPTPRTDSAVVEEDTGYNGLVKTVSPDFARELERENAEQSKLLGEILAVIEERSVGHVVTYSDRLTQFLPRLRQLTKSKP